MIFFFGSVDSFLGGVLEIHGQLFAVVACCFTAVLIDWWHVVAILKPGKKKPLMK